MIIECEHATQSDHQGTIKCAIGKFGGFPHVGVCLFCLAGGQEPPPLRKKAPNEPICKHRGGVTMTTSCCGGKTRPTEIECRNEELPDRVPFGSCNSIYCEFYEIEEKAMKGSSYATRL